ncbi:MAG: hypothetical protein ACYTEN_04400 [Planctomycetota bacterium]
MGNTMSQPDINPDKLVPKPVLKPAIFSVLILVSGIIIGSGVTLMTAERVKKKSVPPGPEYLSRRMINRLVRELNLSPEQQLQLNPIVKQHMEAMEKIRQEARPQISEEIKQMNDSIMALLDEGQKKVWADKIQRMQDNFPRMGSRRGPRSPRDRPEPNSRSDDPRPPRYFRNGRPPENRGRPDAPLPPRDEETERPVRYRD